ncbi:divalent cation tolerance protein CutA [Nocardia sp. NPDC058114]|uniref:divalent cation tolerance protein CutA n=1 Tax=Nocardia sp. NPDC058114 TaxID=3346346 RepID=UPI0036DF55BC
MTQLRCGSACFEISTHESCEQPGFHKCDRQPDCARTRERGARTAGARDVRNRFHTNCRANTNAVGTGPEWRLIFRVAAAGRDRLAERIAESHPWSGPEISATPMPWTTETYAQWVESPTVPQE